MYEKTSVEQLIVQADSLSKHNIALAFKVSKIAITKAEKKHDYQLAGKIAKTSLFKYNPDEFLNFANSELKKSNLPLNDEVYLNHQLMRYYVSVDADFDQSFTYLIKLRALLEHNENNILHHIILGDVYYIAFWINQVQYDIVRSKEYAELMYNHAKKYDLKSLRIYAILGLAELDHHSGNIESAIFQFKSIETELLQANDSLQLNRVYSLLSNAYVDYKNEDSAVYYGKKAYEIVPQSNAQLKAFSTISLARGYINNGKVKSAIKLAEEALKTVESLNAKKEMKDIHFLLSEAYKKNGNYKESLYSLEKYLTLDQEQGSLLSAANISNLESKLEKERHQNQLQIEQKEIIKKDAEIKHQRTQTIALVIGLIFALCLIVISVRSYLVKKKDAETIKIQKHIVEEKNREIMDSITYAKRIQSAILPPTKVVKEYLENSFILYKPKDVVAGDFYWMEHKNGLVLFAAADCTGHGVPGAMVSVVCNNALNRSVREYGITDPGKILDKTREIVIQEFEKSEEEVKDGMDIALCSLQGMELKYAGAHNPLWIIRKNEIIEIKADKQPIGQFDNSESYTTHIIDLESGDAIYIFSDGYVDQFGGEKGKKFKAKAFRELLLSIQDKPMEQQKIIIDESFETWRGALEQIDDVCVIGVSV